MDKDALSALGDRLRRAREARGVSLSEAERHTRIRTKFLKALEAGQVDQLPTAVQLHGFTRNYARYLGLDPDDVLVELDNALHPRRKNPIAAFFQRRAAARQKVASTPAESSRPVAERARRLFQRSKSPSLTIAEPAPPADLTPDDAPDPEPTGPVRLPARSAPIPTTNQPRPALRFRLRRFFTPDVIFVTVAVIAILALFIGGGFFISNQMLTQAQLTQSPAIIGPTEAPTPTATPFANLSFTATSPPPLENFTDIQLVLIIEQRGLVIVTTDGAEVYRAVATPGDRLVFEADNTIEVATSNAAAVRAILNQTDFGVLGPFGQTAVRIFTPNEMRLPTATPNFTNNEESPGS
mgnify:CR=1 FL=1